jgi:hypothetical protein
VPLCPAAKADAMDKGLLSRERLMPTEQAVCAYKSRSGS